jgi:hypothetical protein
MSRFLSLALLGVCFIGTSHAAPFDVPMDPTQSLLTVQLCIAGTCDADSSPVSGTVTIELDSIDNPVEIWLHGFDLHLDNNLHWNLSWGIFGHVTADATGVGVQSAFPGTPLGPAVISGDTFAFTGVPTDSAGVLSYTATGIPCVAMQGAGLPCTDSRNLADLGTQNADQFGGAVTTQDRVVTLSNQIDVTSPLDPNNPSLGTIHVYGNVHGQVSVPVPVAVGDINCDGTYGYLSFGDINPFVLYLSNFAAWQATYPNCNPLNGDINGDGTYGYLSFGDINPFVTLLSGGR